MSVSVYLNSGEKSVPCLVKTFLFLFFFGLHPNLEKKCFIFGEDLFFYGLHVICSPEQNRGRGSSLPKLKIGQNWGKIANYLPPIAQQRSAPLIAKQMGMPTRYTLRRIVARTKDRLGFDGN